jgi:hypothetical protein
MANLRVGIVGHGRSSEALSFARDRSIVAPQAGP